MKRLLLTLALFGSLLNFNVAWADIKSPYNVNFNTTINTTSPTFQVASGWAHLQGESTSGRNVRYTYHETGGVDNSGYMEVGTQNFKVYDEYEPVRVYVFVLDASNFAVAFISEAFVPM